ncbi:MAG: cation:proton antiporter, partial [Cyanobacteria bacterium P01_A01_bin.17]
QIANAFDAITQKLQSDNGSLILAILLALTMAAIANIIHLEAILGAFAAGIILSGTRQQASLLHKLEPLTALLAPVFFIVVGAKTDLSVLNPANPGSIEGLWMAAFLIVVAVIGKVAAGYLIPAVELNRLAIGIGMVPRGEVGLVFVGIGTSVDILSGTLTAAVILTVVVTTLIAPVLLPWTLPNNIASEQQA